MCVTAPVQAAALQASFVLVPDSGLGKACRAHEGILDEVELRLESDQGNVVDELRVVELCVEDDLGGPDPELTRAAGALGRGDVVLLEDYAQLVAYPLRRNQHARKNKI